MKRVKWFISFLVLLGLVGILVGCAKPPEAERAAANQARESALSAGADKYAAADHEAANRLWEGAESKMKEKKYKEAKEGYLAAKAAFEKAAAGVETGKKALMEQVKAALASLEESWKNVEGAAKKTWGKLKDREAWKKDAQAITEGIGKVKEMINSDPFQAKAKVDELKGMVEQWESKLKELGVSPKAREGTKGNPKSTSHETRGFRFARAVVGTDTEGNHF